MPPDVVGRPQLVQQGSTRVHSGRSVAADVERRGALVHLV